MGCVEKGEGKWQEEAGVMINRGKLFGRKGKVNSEEKRNGTEKCELRIPRNLKRTLGHLWQLSGTRKFHS